MSRLTTITASALAVAALAVPATASADHNALRGAPQMFQVDEDTVRVQFALDKKVSKKGVRVAIRDLGSTRKVRADGRHGNDYKYVARVNVDDAVQAGEKYRVRFTIGNDDPVVRQVLLREAR